jgi:enoyl-CoA hydratase/carnithine racemase
VKEARPVTESNLVLYEARDGVARITLNRPEAMNAFTAPTIARLRALLEEAERDDEVGVVVVTGAGERAFCTGADVKEFAEKNIDLPSAGYLKVVGAVCDTIKYLQAMTKPTIARVNGAAVGGGNELQAACDLCVAAEHAYFMQVGPRVGSVPAGGATQWLPLLVGDRRAREILYLCRPISARQALEWGLVNRVVPYGELDRAVDEMCQEILDKFPECLRFTKVQANFLKEFLWNQTYPAARDWLALHVSSAETREGMTAFVEKRKPDVRRLRRLRPFQRCRHCGATGLSPDFRYCGQCGKELDRPERNEK